MKKAYHKTTKHTKSFLQQIKPKNKLKCNQLTRIFFHLKKSKTKRICAFNTKTHTMQKKQQQHIKQHVNQILCNISVAK